MPPRCWPRARPTPWSRGVTRNYSTALNDVRKVLDVPAGQRPIGVLVIFAKGRVIFAADTSVHELPTSDQLADIAMQAARVAKRFGFTPRVALLASSTFGFPAQRTQRTHRRGGAHPRQAPGRFRI